MLRFDGQISDQRAVVGSNSQTAPCSSIGAIAIPPLPENIYIFPFSVQAAVPTRGEGDWDVAGLQVMVLPLVMGFSAVVKFWNSCIDELVTYRSMKQRVHHCLEALAVAAHHQRCKLDY